MKIAITGKGGAGKSTIAGTLARQLARSGHRVVAIDGDPNPNLGLSIGLGLEATKAMQPILNALIDIGYTHNDPKISPDELLARYAVAAPDGVTVVATGKMERPTDSCLCCGSHSTTRQFFDELPDDDRTVVADLEAGLNDLAWVSPGEDDVVLIIAEPSAKALDVATRSLRMANELGVKRVLGVANRSANGTDAAALADALDGLEVLSVPDDPSVEKASHRGVAPIDANASSPAMAAIAGLADRLLRL